MGPSAVDLVTGGVERQVADERQYGVGQRRSRPLEMPGVARREHLAAGMEAAGLRFRTAAP
jgi:hypothetical protein